MADTFALRIITPDKVFYEGDVEMAEFNTTEGEIGIYRNHVPMTVIIKPGVLTITETDGEKKALQDYANTHGISMADALKNAFFDMLEDQYDIKASDEAYVAYLADPETISMAEMKKKYGI